MFQRRLTSQVINYICYQCKLNAFQQRNFQKDVLLLCSKNTTENREVVVKNPFEAVKNKNKNTYLDLIKLFETKSVHRRGHVEFIYTALKNMECFNLQKDLEVYKALLDVFPKGKFIPTNIYQAEFMHYPKQQQCAIDLLQQMEDNGVMPDCEMEDILMNIFGKRGHPLRKYWRMMYWMPKFKNLSPWPVPNPPPNDAFDLAKLAIERISKVDIQSKLTIYHTVEVDNSLENTWIISSQSPSQKGLLIKHNIKEPLYLEGPFKVWLRNKCVDYFILKGNPKAKNTTCEDTDDVSNIKVEHFNITPPISSREYKSITVHEQEDGIIFGLCATGTSSKQSLVSWIRHLNVDNNSQLDNVPIVFTLKTGEKEIISSNQKCDKN